MLAGIGFTASYIVYFKFIDPANNVADAWWFGISPEGIGTLGMLLNFAITLSVSRFTQAPPDDVQSMVLMIREPQEEINPMSQGSTLVDIYRAEECGESRLASQISTE